MRSASHSLDVLLLVEDPGAANYVAGLPEALAARGFRSRLLAEGVAREYLGQRNVPFDDVAAHPDQKTAFRLLDEFRPRLVIVGTSENPETLGLKLIDACRQIGILSVGAVDSVSNSAFRFRGCGDDALGHAPDWLLVPDDWTKDSYVALGYPAGRIEVCGHPQYDRVKAAAEEFAVRDRRRLRETTFPGATAESRVVVFVAEISGGLNPQQYRKSDAYTLRGWGASTGRTEIVFEELLGALREIHPKPYLVLRLHPKNTPDEFAAYQRGIDLVSRDGSPLELIWAADLAVGMTSMLLLEASILGRPTLSIVPREIEKSWLLTIAAKITPCATTREAVRTLLTNSLSATPTGPNLGSIFTFGSMDKIIEFIDRRFGQT
jgi:hypothetical protein